MEKKMSYIKGLDGLRMIAITGVILYHMFPFTIKGGYLGVVLFFILSGFLLSVGSGGKAMSWKGIGNFYKKRFFRIYPTVFFVVFLTAAVFRIFAPVTLTGSKMEVLSIFGGYNNIWQISQNASYFARMMNASPFLHMWSLAIELQYYLIWPLILLFYSLFRRKSGKAADLFLLVLTLAFSVTAPVLYRPNTDVTRLYYGTDTRIFSLFMGALAGMVYRRKKAYLARLPKKLRSRGLFLILPLVLLVVTVITFLTMDGQSAVPYRGGMFLMSILFSLMVLFCADESLPYGKILEWKPLKWIGQRSYEMYLWMYPVIFLFSFKKWDKNAFSYILQIVLIVLLSAWIHWFVKHVKGMVSVALEYMNRLGRAVVFAIVFIMVAGVVFGAASVIASPAKANDEQALRQELDKGRQAISGDASGQASASGSASGTAQASADSSLSGTDASSSMPFDPSIQCTFIGDSLMLSASDELSAQLPNAYIDAKESRQPADAVDIINQLSQDGKLYHVVVLELGTNGVFSDEIGKEIMTAIGPDRQVYWLNVYGQHLQWQDKVNSSLSDLSSQYSNLHVVDWVSLASQNPQWFYQDGVHVKQEGQDALVGLIIQQLQQYESEHPESFHNSGSSTTDSTATDGGSTTDSNTTDGSSTTDSTTTDGSGTTDSTTTD